MLPPGVLHLFQLCQALDGGVKLLRQLLDEPLSGRGKVPLQVPLQSGGTGAPSAGTPVF